MTSISDDSIQLRGVCKHYGEVRAVDGVDLTVRRGELFGLIGHNGAGKSTLFKMMLGLIAPSAGELRVAGGPVRGPSFRVARRRMGYLPENLVLYDNLTGLEVLQFFARLKGADAAQCPVLLARVGLSDAGHRAVREYSKGMRQRLGFAQALLGSPQLLFLDEPTTGLDPAAIRDFYAVLDELRAQGVTLVITSHILAELQARVDRLAIMANGRIVAEGSVQDLRERSRMPLIIDLRAPSAQRAVLRADLAGVAGLSIQEDESGMRIACPRESKMIALAALAPHAASLQDLQINEPSLEDLFFGMKVPS